MLECVLSRFTHCCMRLRPTGPRSFHRFNGGRPMGSGAATSTARLAYC
jgi:hypothetical protein